MTSTGTAIVLIATSMAEIDAAQWDACANPDPARFNPFVTHAFRIALEQGGTVNRRTGLIPQHLVLEWPDGKIVCAMPCYLTGHSRGEYVFDWAWADAYERAGGTYYPKLLCAVPFTPVPGPRLLVRPGPEQHNVERTLAAAAITLAKKLGVSSLHINFLTEGEWQRLPELGFLQRTDQQFHWHNQGYSSFDDFLVSLASRKRKAVRRERAQALAPGITIEHVTGADIREEHWDAFFDFYMD